MGMVGGFGGHENEIQSERNGYAYACMVLMRE